MQSLIIKSNLEFTMSINHYRIFIFLDTRIPYQASIVTYNRHIQLPTGIRCHRSSTNWIPIVLIHRNKRKCKEFLLEAVEYQYQRCLGDFLEIFQYIFLKEVVKTFKTKLLKHKARYFSDNISIYL